MTEHNIRVRFEENWGPSGISIVKSFAIVLRKTPKGAWCRRLAPGYAWQREAIQLGVDDCLMTPCGKEFFVLDGFGSRKYHETDELAWRFYKARKRHAVTFAERRYRIQKEAAALCENVEQPPESGKLTVNPEWNRALSWSEL